MIDKFKEWCKHHNKDFGEELEMALIAHMKDDNFFVIQEPTKMDMVNEGIVDLREDLYRVILIEYANKTPKDVAAIRKAAHALSEETGIAEDRALADLWSILIPEKPLIL
jgi:hypothetical protein